MPVRVPPPSSSSWRKTDELAPRLILCPAAVHSPPPTRFLLSVSKDVTIELCLVFSRLLIMWLLECRCWYQNSSSSEAFVVYFAYPDEEICCLLCKFLHFLSSWCNRDVRDEWVGFRDMIIVLVSSFFPAVMMKYDAQVSCGDTCLLVDSLLWQSWSTRSLLASPWTNLPVAVIESVGNLLPEWKNRIENSLYFKMWT